MASLNTISPSQLLRLIGLPDAPAIVDVRTDEDFAADPALIPGAHRFPHTDIAAIRAHVGTRRAVIVCHRGAKLSQGVAAWLHGDGLAADALDGGMVAWRALSEAPAIPTAALPPRVGGSQLWVTRHRPKIDRIACPWLIRRFVDPSARFLFVSPSEVQAVADRFGATPFDIDGAAYSHHGDLCSFDTMLDTWNLRIPALDRLAIVVRAADTNRHDLAPQAAGLLALSVGLSRQFRDDQAQLAAALPLYDALYRWARDGADEGHDWTPEREA
jgi:rhodanese-related sulfurtransferase